MEIRRVWAAYFSATDTTKRITEFLAGRIAADLRGDGQMPAAERTSAEPDAETGIPGVPDLSGNGPSPEHLPSLKALGFTLPSARGENVYDFQSTDLVVFGMPVYAGRLPNLVMPFVKKGFRGSGALAVPVVLYGNRNYDDALIELRNLLEDDGFHTIAAAAFIGEHSFSRILGAGRPDEADFRKAASFADQAASLVRSLDRAPAAPIRGEQPLRPYYQPRDRNGRPVNFLKAKPLTKDTCTRCGICAAVCPLGSVDPEDPSRITGKCMKCCACVKKCPVHAKYFIDEGFLYHRDELEAMYAGTRREPEFFLPDPASI